MMYHYMTMPDETVVTHSHLIISGNTRCIKVHFERPVNGGFFSARCQLPEYRWEYVDGFSRKEIEGFLQFMKENEDSLLCSAESRVNNHTTEVTGS